MFACYARMRMPERARGSRAHGTGVQLMHARRTFVSNDGGGARARSRRVARRLWMSLFAGVAALHAAGSVAGAQPVGAPPRIVGSSESRPTDGIVTPSPA